MGPDPAANNLTAFPFRQLDQPEILPLLEERRRADRFPIQREVRYRSLAKRASPLEGVGKTINISSNGVIFTPDAESEGVTSGTKLELSISWPAQLDNRCLLKLLARGRVSRLDNGAVAVQIEQYEFRTAGRV